MTQLLISLGFLFLFIGILTFSVFALPAILFFRLIKRLDERHNE